MSWSAGRAPAEPRRIAVTLDDGYRDNLDMRCRSSGATQVPFTIYVCPGFSDRTSELWWEALERIIAGADAIAAPGGRGGAMLPTRTLRRSTRRFALDATG